MEVSETPKKHASLLRVFLEVYEKKLRVLGEKLEVFSEFWGENSEFSWSFLGRVDKGKWSVEEFSSRVYERVLL